MRPTFRWQEWAADLGEVRLRQTVQQIQDHLYRTGALTEVDELMLKLCTAELERRYK